MKRVYGIDLGTTYSCISWVDEHGKPVIIPNSEGESTTPSAVYFETPNNIVVGQTAKEVAKLFEDRVVQAVKRAMGEPHWEFECFDKIYKPQEISALILRKIVNDAAGELGETIEDVVITCPAYFGSSEKEATKQAGEIADLNVLYVIPEPTAAAIAYGLDLDQDQVVLVYDLGGGTFDVTMIDVREGGIEVIATGGEKELGGKDWDSDIVSFFAQEFQNQTGKSGDALLDDPESYQELLREAERCKKTLSTRTTHTQRIQFDGERVTVELTREHFDQITASRLEQTLALTRDVLTRGKDKGYGKIDVILLVGGSTYMPQVMERVEAEFQDCVVKRTDPNQIVAKGAALFGYRCQLDQEIKILVSEKTGADLSTTDEVPDIVLEEAQRDVAASHGLTLPGLKQLVDTDVINVSSKSFGLKVIDPSSGEAGVTNLVFIDDPVPKTITQDFSTHDEGQTEVKLEVFENHDRNTDANSLLDPEAECTFLGEAQLSFLRALPQGSPIQITFELTPDGLLKLNGKDLTTHQEIQAEFKTESLMPAEDMATAKSHALSLQVS